MIRQMAFVQSAGVIYRKAPIRLCSRWHVLQLRHQSHRAVFSTSGPLISILTASASPPAVSPIREGTIIQINTANRFRLARIVRSDGKRNWIVEDAGNLTLSVNPKQISYVLGHPDETADLVKDLDSLQSSAQARASECAELLETAWEVISSGEGINGGTTTTITQLSDILLSDTTSLSRYATYLLLSSDSLFFKGKTIKGELLFEARTTAQLNEARAVLEAKKLREQQAEQRRDAIFDAYLSADVDAFHDALGPNSETVMTAIENIALELDGNFNIDSKYGSSTKTAFHQFPNILKSSVLEVFSALTLPLTPTSAFDILTKLGVFTKHENITLRNASLPDWKSIDENTSNVIKHLLSDGAEDIDSANRVDLTHLKAIAIDSAETTEVDDAFSWDPETDRIYVHIADPSRYFPDGYDNPVVQEAMRRTATLYLPSTKSTMFPDDLAIETMSLCGRKSDGSALTFSFRILEDGVIADDMDIQLTRISIPTRLTYEEAERALGDDSNQYTQLLFALSERMERRRTCREIDGGAIIINTPLNNVFVKNPESEEPEVRVEVVRTDSFAWLIVSELMISACVVAATIAKENKLVVPFRGQDTFEYPPDDVLEAVPDGPVRATLVFKNAGPSEVGITAKEHASLGLDAYVQATSPIRRSLDFIVHLQLKAWLRGKARGGTELEGALDEETVLKEISRAQTMGRTLRTVESRTNRYWILEMLRRNGSDIQYRGVYLRDIKERVGLIHLDDYAFTVGVDLGTPCKPGDVVNVTVLSVNPRTGNLQAIGRRLTQDQAGENGERNDDSIDWGAEMDDAMSDISSTQSVGENTA